jgi:hypothetical protein
LAVVLRTFPTSARSGRGECTGVEPGPPSTAPADDFRWPTSPNQPEYPIAKEKCDALAGDVKDACIEDAKLRFGQT